MKKPSPPPQGEGQGEGIYKSSALINPLSLRERELMEQ